MSNLPEKPGGTPGEGPPARLTNRDFELVIRRAAELQARAVEDPTGDGVETAEVIRIGKELGLTDQYLHRALAEVQGSEAEETGVMARAYGPSAIRVGRVIRGQPQKLSSELESYLINREYLTVLRRLPDRILFTRSAGATAAVGRAMSRAFSRRPPLDFQNLELSARGIEDDFAYISLVTSVGTQRTGAALTSIGGGLSGGAMVAAFLGIAITPLAALGGVPILLGSIYGGKLYYSNAMAQARTQLESLLDRLEHGDLESKAPPSSFMGFGLTPGSRTRR